MPNLKKGAINAMSSKKWIIIFIAAALICTFFIFVPKYKSSSDAAIMSDGKEICSISLNSPDRSFDIQGKYGTNTITLKNGEIYVSKSSCPDKICVNHGPLKSASSPIVCLPNRLVIYIKNSAGSNAADAVSR